MLIFNVDIVKSNTDTRFIIRSIESLEKAFVKNNYKFNIYTNFKNMDEIKDKIFTKKESLRDLKKDLEKIILCDLQTEIYPELEKILIK